MMKSLNRHFTKSECYTQTGTIVNFVNSKTSIYPYHIKRDVTNDTISYAKNEVMLLTKLTEIMLNVE